MGAQCQLLSMGRGTLLLPPRLEGADPAGEQQPDDSKYPRKYARPVRPEHRHHQTSHTITSHWPSMSSSPVTRATRRRPQQGCDTHGAAAAKSKDLGFHPRAGVGRRDIDGALRRKSGALRASPPSWSDLPAKGFPRALPTPPTARLHQRRWQTPVPDPVERI
jgi:hypothetical protein